MTITWNSNVYAQERSILKVTNIANNADVIRIAGVGGLSSYVADYRLASEREIEIDLTDLVRIANGSAYVVEMADGSTLSSTIIQFSRVGLINPNTAYIPNPLHSDDSEVVIAPPSVIYSGSVQDSILVYVYSNTHTYACRFSYANGTLGALTMLQNGITVLQPSQPNPSEFRILRMPTGLAVCVVTYRPQNECQEYVTIRWAERFSGRYKTAVFLRTRNTYETQGAIELENIKNEYTVKKGFEQGFIASIDDLTPYDVWYYGDIVNSSDVQVLSESYEWVSVDVATKSVTIPDSDSGKPNNFEIEIKYKRYDAI